ncbi:MAG: YerC/YecD family TrpR-related protein, partial [Patescibacteria group bacterium]|nr:YerC/YecD family TrpR-related protein [Patescibacteria group bacterium]
KISSREREELLKEFCEAISVLKNSQEIMDFITDLLTKQEMIMLAKRIKIAKLLLEGQNYRDIESSLKVGNATIARVNQWLLESGEGFRIIAERTKKEKPKLPSSWDYAMEDWRRFRRRYPLMFWPQLLIEDIIKMMSKRQKDRIRQRIKKLDQKSILYKQINRILKS